MSITPGTRLGPYEILAPLGAGGMGEVFRARDSRLGREVALKVLPEAFSLEPERLRRFEQEARSASALSDPHIVTVFDVGESNGIHYFASELVEGSDLRRLLADGPPPLKKALDLAGQIASGLAAAHEKGIVHRDLKPENVLIAKSGLAKIADFGLAKLTEPSGAKVSELPTSDGHQTSAGVVLGTVAYMSPEQARSAAVDYRSDQFAFGSILYEMLAGRRPFRGDSSTEALAAILRDEPEPLDKVAPEVPDPVRWIVERCLAKEPGERYDSTRDLARELAGCRTHLLEAGVAAPAPAAIARVTSRRFVVAGVVAAVVIAVVLVVLARRKAPESPGPLGSSLAQPARIVVLPFENLGSPEDAYFAGGITEEITSRLANVRKLGVISRTTATEYPRKGKTVKQVGAELGVDWVLEGTIRCDRSSGGPGRVRITPQLIRVSDDTHVWSERYDRTLTDIFSLQSDVATKTVEAIGISLLPAEKRSLESIPTKDLAAYDHYLKALAANARSTGRSDVEEALGHYQAAAKRDPSFAQAFAQVSILHLAMYWLFYDRSAERLAKARAAAEAAARLGPDLPETHNALGYLYYWGSRDYARATEEFNAARRIYPNSPGAIRGLAFVVRRQGRWEESAKLFAEAAKLDPRNALVLGELAFSLALSRRYREADDAFATTISLSPQYAAAHGNRLWLQVLWRGDVVKAKTLLAQAEAVPGLRDDSTPYLALSAYQLSLVERDFAGALRRLEGESRKAYFSQFYFLTIDFLRSQVYHLAGRADECRRTADKARILLEEELKKQSDDGRLQGALGIALAFLDRDDEALRAARRGVELMPTSKDALIALSRIEDLAFVYAILGRQDEAIEQLDVLLSASGEMTPHVLRLDPRWDPLRKNPKFEALLTKYEVKP